MSIREYLDAAPLTDIVKYRSNPATAAEAYIGTLRKHPYDHEKCLIFMSQPDEAETLREGAILEFRISDVLGAEELPSTVDESGATMQRVRLWIRRGAIALRYESFEVGAPQKEAAGPPDRKPAMHHAFRHEGNADPNI